MLKRRGLVFLSLFLSGLVLGVLIGLPFCPPAPTEENATAVALGQAFIIILALAIPISYLTLMAIGAMSVTRPPRVLADQQPTWVPATRRLTRVLVTAGGGANARLGLEVAARIADDDDARVTVMRVLAPEQASQREGLEAELTGIATQTLGTDYPVSVLVTTATSVVDAVVAEAARGYDLLVVGASEERPLRNWLFGAMPDLIARQAPCPVLVVRGHPAEPA